MNASVPLRLASVRSIASGVLSGVLSGAAFAGSAGGAVTAAELSAAPAAPAQIAQVTVVRAANACFSASIRVTGFLVAREQAVVTLDAPGLRVTEVLVSEGDKVTAGQTLVRLARQPADGPDAAAARNITALRAPAAGVVTRSTAVVGATAPAGPGKPLFQIAIDGEVELEAEVPSIHVPGLASGQAARVEVEGRELSGRLRLVPAVIDPRTQLGRARLSLDREPALRLGTFARATIEASRSCGVSVPGSAVLYRTGGASVLVVRDDVVETRLVQVGLHSDTATEIREGLQLGDLVIANAGSSLRDGDKVRPVVSDTAR
jgi:multidrug efflux pump subunit AcrA (membrane-fusion protein)